MFWSSYFFVQPYFYCYFILGISFLFVRITFLPKNACPWGFSYLAMLSVIIFRLLFLFSYCIWMFINDFFCLNFIFPCILLFQYIMPLMFCTTSILSGWLVFTLVSFYAGESLFLLFSCLGLGLGGPFTSRARRLLFLGLGCFCKSRARRLLYLGLSGSFTFRARRLLFLRLGGFCTSRARRLLFPGLGGSFTSSVHFRWRFFNF